ncbi:rRNA N(6)-adenosine-methyltransferase ZCCHC4-like [Amphiura filiformis]|uniref:rRNA N(6)-adenosine-methyltransferase ZCCHC4-like n=1 Tax=Amphiura filiformis TaxID=82378 RepID=UPI003B217324
MSSGGHRGGLNMLGVDVCLDEDKLTNAPHCPHGPALLFERYIGDTVETRRTQQYYGCSACRDRKDCDFFQNVGEKVSEASQKAREMRNNAQQPWKSHADCYSRYTQTMNAKEQERRYCHQCSLFLMPDEIKLHRNHNVTHGLSLAQMQKPSHLLKPIENKKTNAQYLFSDNAVDFLLDTISKLGFKKVLCVGAPRIHEAIQVDKLKGLESLLLDLDHRYGQFYPPDLFCRYNMCNHYFMDGDESQDVFRKFLNNDEDDDIVMVTDPPFGGLVEVIAFGVKWIMETWKQINNKDDKSSLPTMWVFPYFLESRIKACLPSFTMLDYKVAYDNHPLFQNKAKGNKKGSPVRIFTNIDASKFVLPKQEGYRYCSPCTRYVSSENHHCKQCQACTSKDGSTYKHCDVCQKCVKPSYTHCITCQRCELPTHSCNKMLQGCHICGASDHKRRECPNRGHHQRPNQSNTKKRKHQGGVSTPPKSQKLLSQTKTVAIGNQDSFKRKNISSDMKQSTSGVQKKKARNKKNKKKKWTKS